MYWQNNDFTSTGADGHADADADAEHKFKYGRPSLLILACTLRMSSCASTMPLVPGDEKGQWGD